MITVPSLMPGTDTGGRRALGKLAGKVALAEVRLDGGRVKDLHRLLGGKRPPVIVTCRSRREGGKYNGSVRSTVRRLEEALSAGAEFIDVEERLGRRAISRLLTIGGRARIILSRHDPVRTPRNSRAVFTNMTKYRPGIVKYAFTAKSFEDTLQARRLLRLASRSRQPAVVISMGEYGQYTRVLQGFLGGALSFASLEGDRPTAPGQVDFAQMRDLYRSGSIDARTKIYGLLGNPVSSSRGTRFHNEVFIRLKRNAVYLNFLVDDLEVFMSTNASFCSGLSVTMPFKSDIIAYVDRMHSSASLTGSVNTIVRRDGKLFGINTDYMAFCSMLKNAISPRGKKLLVLGTGGTARSVAAAGARLGARLTVAGRNAGRSKRLADEYGGSWATLPDLPGLQTDVLVNATPVGMNVAGRPGDTERIVPASTLRGSTLICDFPNPPKGRTLLVREARARKRRVITGAEIFRAQASLQSRYFLTAEGPG